MRNKLRLLIALIYALSLTAVGVAHAAPQEQDQSAFSRKGADSCLQCHDEGSEFPVMAIFKTPHGAKQDKRSPMAGLQCEACHGPGGEHSGRIKPGDPRPAMPHFGPNASADIQSQNQQCLNCHQGDHGKSHQVHATHDPVSSAAGELQLCGGCHTQQKAETLMPSAHPLRNAEMRCSDCHAAHGSDQHALLKGFDPNQSCFDCHAEKRGPFLWEHAPATEDCGLCHQAHGSSHPALLTQRPPFLCQQCHSQAGHPSVGQTPSGGPSSMQSLRSCGNCHSQVHGSNHPSGASLLR